MRRYFAQIGIKDDETGELAIVLGSADFETTDAATAAEIARKMSSIPRYKGAHLVVVYNDLGAQVSKIVLGDKPLEDYGVNNRQK